MEIVDQDLFDVTEGIICHAVNAMGVMGSGVALAVKRRWPDYYAYYAETCALHKDNPARMLGMADYAGCGRFGIPDRMWVVNMHTQVDYNRRGQNKRHTNYGAVADGFARVRGLRSGFGFPKVYIPYLMGCDRGGASWDIFTEIVDQVCPGVIACRIGK